MTVPSAGARAGAATGSERSAGASGESRAGRAKAPDLRLAGLAGAGWLTALAGLHLGRNATILVTAAGAVATVGGMGFQWYRTRGRQLGEGRSHGRHRAMRRPGTEPPGRYLDRYLNRYGWIVVAVLLGVVCGGAATAARLVVRDAAPIAALVRAGAEVTVDVVLRDDPRAARNRSARAPLFVVRAELSTLSGADGQRLSAPARILVLGTDPGWRHLLPGQRVTASGRLVPPRGGDLTAAVLSTTSAPVPHGKPSWAQRAAGRLRAGLQRACLPLPDEPGGLLPGLVVGDTSRLSSAVEDDFQIAGMTHLNAVSGSNVAIVVGLVLLLARWCRVGPGLTALLCGLALVGFVILARPSPSVVRAAAMGAIGLAALAAGRSRAALPALSAAVLGLVLLDPELAGDPGFALSVLATGGLLLLAPRWRDGLRRRGVPVGAAEALAVPAAAQVACAPVVAGLSGTVSLVAVPANLLATPAVAPATVLGVVTAVLSPVWTAGAEFTAWLGSWPAWWLVLVARYAARLPAAALPWPDGVPGGLLLGGLTLALLVAVRRRLARRLVAVVASALVVGALPVRLVAPGWPPEGWVLAVCSVGQGDASVLPVAPGQAVVVDAGPEPAAVDACLRRLGVRSVPLLIFSHLHADHVGGAAGVTRGRRVGTVITPQWPEPAIGRETVRVAADRAGAIVTEVGAGWRWAVDPSAARHAGPALSALTVLGPPYPMRGTRSDPNNNSLVLLAQVGAVRVLLGGDAEVEEQRALLDTLASGALRADILKLPHHGSAYQEPAFLDAVDPAVAMVSVGAGNDYGHPNEALLGRLRRGGVRVLRTDLDGDGAVVWTERGLAVAVRGAAAELGRRDVSRHRARSRRVRSRRVRVGVRWAGGWEAVVRRQAGRQPPCPGPARCGLPVSRGGTVDDRGEKRGIK